MENLNQEKQVKSKKRLWLWLLMPVFILLAVIWLASSGKQKNNSADRVKNGIQPVTSVDWIKGSPQAKVIIIEYSDLECPYCKRQHSELEKLFNSYSNRELALIFRHLPLVSLHSRSLKEALAAECAGELGGNDRFWRYIDYIFSITPSNNGLNLNELPMAAVQLGLDRNQFEACLSSGRAIDKIQRQANEAVAAGAQGTPYILVVSGQGYMPLSGAVPYEQLKTFVDSLLK